MNESLADLAKYLGKNFGRDYNYHESVVQFTIRLLTELKNSNQALKTQLTEIDLSQLDGDPTIPISLASIQEILSGKIVTLSIGRKTIRLIPDDALHDFIVHR